MQKLWPFVEKRGIVLIAFQNKMLSLAEMKA